MPLKRSRPRTEEKFQDAVVDLIAEAGCGVIGINAVAQRAGADKVLIYRYFGDLNGLWQRVAESRSWLPDLNALLDSVTKLQDPVEVLRRIMNELTSWFRSDTAAGQLVAWRKATHNPLTDHFRKQWHLLWQALGEALSTGLDLTQRRQWSCACELAALAVEAEVCGEGVDSQCVDALANSLELGRPTSSSASTLANDTLPTNLL